LPQLDFQVGRKIKNMLSLQIIQVAIEGTFAIRVKETFPRFRPQHSGLRTNKALRDPKSSLKLLILPNNC
jgi:hypothetical protein